MKPSPYAGFDPLSESEMWEDRTRDLVLRRVNQVPGLRFFSEDEARLLDAVVDRVMPQPDRSPEDRIPVTPFIDEMLTEGETDGFRKSHMPWDEEVWRQAVAGIDQTSRARHGRPFVYLDEDEQDGVLSAIQRGDAEGEVWSSLDASSAFEKILQEIVSIYYSHPSAWAEIGWPGPASKRGYMRTGYGQRDPWQPREGTPVPSIHIVEGRVGGHAPSGSAGGTH